MTFNDLNTAVSGHLEDEAIFVIDGGRILLTPIRIESTITYHVQTGKWERSHHVVLTPIPAQENEGTDHGT